MDVFYVHTDHLDTPRKITRPGDNVIVWRWDSDAFGTTLGNEDPDGDGTLFVFNLRFPGQYYDQESGLHYNYYRDYDPQTGRYVQSDPIGLEGGLNTYLYARANPLSYIDPTGENTVAVPTPGSVPLPGWAGPAAGVAGAGWAGWQLGSAIYPHIAAPLGDFIDNICRDADREERCNKQYYEVDIPTCRGISRTRGKAAGARCYAAAAERYAACLRGKSIPPLDTWNN